MRQYLPATYAMIAAVSTAAWFVLSTTVMAQVPDGWSMLVALTVAVVLVAAFWGMPRRADIVDLRSASRLVTGGAFAFAAAPLIVLSQRVSDAPSGSESLFFTTAGWALALCVVGLFDGPRRSSLLQAAACVLGTVGSAVVLANWERPSSFSPFVKFPEAELLMLLAGLVFGAGLLLIGRSGSVPSRARPALALAGALFAALLVAPTFGGTHVASVMRVWPQLLLMGAAAAAGAIAWPQVIRARGVTVAAAPLFVVPVAITALSLLERVLGAMGPDPVLWPAAGAGALMALCGSVILWSGTAEPRKARARSPLDRTVLAVAGVSLVLGVASLVRPALRATSAGAFPDGRVFDVGWVMIGAEAASGWLPLAAALMAVAAVLTASGRSARTLGLLGAGVALLAYPVVARVPFHTWTRWIPADVQQAYGTEYARFQVDTIHDPVRLVAIGVCGLALVVVLIWLWSGAAAGSEERTAGEESR